MLDGGHGTQCATDDASTVYSIDDSNSNFIDKHQHDVVIGVNTVEIGTVDA